MGIITHIVMALIPVYKMKIKEFKAVQAFFVILHPIKLLKKGENYFGFVQ